MPRLPARELLAAAFLLALGGCHCGGAPAVTTVFTDVEYTPGGRALVLESTDGLYVASPPTDTPRRLSEQHCSSSASYALDCARVSADGQRIAALLSPRDEEGTRLWELHLWALTEGSALGSPPPGGKAAERVLDARFTPDGRELIWARPGSAPSTIALYRLGADGGEVELIPTISIGTTSLSSAMDALVLTTSGVAYPRLSDEGLELWLRTFDGEYLDIGRLPDDCAGSSMSLCVFATPDGASLAWQEKGSGVLHLYRADKLIDLPLGQGYGLGFSNGGSFVLRMDVAPEAAYVQRADTAALVRGVGASSAELSFDSETIAYLVTESTALGTSRLLIGPTRQDGRDNDYGVFAAPPVRPLFGGNVGLGAIGHAFTGDGRFVILATATEDQSKESASLVAVNAWTSERQQLDTLSCEHCCTAAPEGALVVCLPELSTATGPMPVDLYDPATGKKTRASERAIDVQPLSDGSGVGVLQYVSDVPEALVVTKDGRSASLGSALRFALSPNGPQIALLSSLGSLEVRSLP